MPTLPWTTVDPTPTGEVVVMASSFRVRGFRHVLPFFLDAMVTAEPHRSVMRGQRAAMRSSAFAFWTAPAGETPTWDEARRRLALRDS